MLNDGPSRLRSFSHPLSTATTDQTRQVRSRRISSSTRQRIYATAVLLCVGIGVVWIMSVLSSWTSDGRLVFGNPSSIVQTGIETSNGKSGNSNIHTREEDKEQESADTEHGGGRNESPTPRPKTTTLPIPTTTVNNNNKTKVLVVYSGPTTLNTTGNDIAALKNELYIKNFEYFVRHGGVDCRYHDTLLVVTESVQQYYQDEIDQYQAQYCNGDHFVKLVSRENICFDMESVRLVLYGLVDGVRVSDYDYFVYANCGTSGPAIRDTSTLFPQQSSQYVWTDEFVQRFDETVHMVGVSHHCYPVKDTFRPHVQSIAYALDRKGLELVLQSGAVYDCRKGGGGKGSVIERYEVGMSRYIMNAGYGVRSIVRNVTLTNYTGPCTGRDIWMTHRMKEYYGGRLPSINETIFFKTSRVLTPEIANLINYTRPIRWNW